MPFNACSRCVAAPLSQRHLLLRVKRTLFRNLYSITAAVLGLIHSGIGPGHQRFTAVSSE
ncbi:hypothetical protein HMSLTHF_01220 [Vreelandella aquamarina]|uniref:Uncharacterized protein n=1 Tax=Vreelandella aquamarina TaxID=77097 RepID=A0A6F8SQV7_9GAMM|nr:hypothetical protein HMSLTHF_01220 [Halomonas meridiana]